MLGVENGLAHPTVSARVNLPLRQIHLGSLAAAVQLFDLTPADGTWRVLGPERPRHRNGEFRDLRRCRRPPLVGGVPPKIELCCGHTLGPLTRLPGSLTSELRLGHSPGCALRMPGTASRPRRSATDPSVPRSLPCWARSETIDPGHSGGTNGRSRTRSSWTHTVSVIGRGEVSERVRIGCARWRADRPGLQTKRGANPRGLPATLAGARFGRVSVEGSLDAGRAHPTERVGAPPTGQRLDLFLAGQRQK
jgi:hypothetical protein